MKASLFAVFTAIALASAASGCIVVANSRPIVTEGATCSPSGSTDWCVDSDRLVYCGPDGWGYSESCYSYCRGVDCGGVLCTYGSCSVQPADTDDICVCQ